MQQFSLKLLAISLFLLIASFSVAANNNDIRVYDQGTDGGMRLYSVTCPNKETTVIAQVIETSGEEGLAQEITVLPDSDSGGLGASAQNIKDKALELIGQQNRSEICIYFDNTEECKSYKDVDSAAQAACDLIR